MADVEQVKRRELRLAAKLRENLRRRKQQQRARGKPAADRPGGPGDGKPKA